MGTQENPCSSPGDVRMMGSFLKLHKPSLSYSHMGLCYSAPRHAWSRLLGAQELFVELNRIHLKRESFSGRIGACYVSLPARFKILDRREKKVLAHLTL